MIHIQATCSNFSRIVRGIARELRPSRLLLALMLLAAAPTASSETLTTDDYVRTLGQVSPTEDINVLRAQAVFAKLTRVTNRVAGSHIRLVVVDSDTRPWAIAVPDGGIVLSRGALRICYNGDPKHGDTRMAFVLGHELSHLTAGDFWHQDVHLQFANQTGASDVERVRDTLARAAGVSSDADINDFLVRLRERELVADDSGFLIAAIAGYDVASLVEDEASNFLHDWVAETGGYSDVSHFSAAERSAFLRQRLRRLRSRALLFDVGVRLGLSGYHEEGIRLLHEFEQDFPTKQLFSNIGYFYLVSAIDAMPVSVATRWWFPTLATTKIDSGIQYRGVETPEIGPVAREQLERARRYLELAVQADELFVPALINLAVTEYYLNNPHAARAHVESIRQVDPDDRHARAMQAPLLIAQNPEMDMSAAALALIADLAEAEDADDYVRYNYAQLLEETGDTTRARAVRQQLVANNRGLPQRIDSVLCGHIDRDDGCSEALDTKVVDILRDAPVAQDAVSLLGARIDDAAAQAVVVESKRQSYDTDLGVIEIYVNADGRLFVARDGLVIFVSTPIPATMDGPQLIGGDGGAQRQTELASGAVRHYRDGFSLFTDGPIVRELWFGASLGK